MCLKPSLLAGFAVLFLFVLLPTSAGASSIVGTVKDSSGALMPNVTVEATSPVLIEKSRTVTTNGQGRYEIIDLRPGTLFAVVHHERLQDDAARAVDVPADTSVPVYIEMSVGAVGETVEVQAVANVVDVENAANRQVLTRQVQDSIPIPRNMQALGGLTPGIQLHNAAGGNPDVGGSQQMEQTYIVGHGSSANQTTVLLDGMNINSNYLDGTIQNYVDNGIIQQATYQTSGVTAEVSCRRRAGQPDSERRRQRIPYRHLSQRNRPGRLVAGQQPQPGPDRPFQGVQVHAQREQHRPYRRLQRYRRRPDPQGPALVPGFVTLPEHL